MPTALVWTFAVVTFSAVAVEAEQLESVFRESLCDEPLVKPRAAASYTEGCAVSRAVIVDVIDSQEFRLSLAAAGTLVAVSL
jgi:anti-sigma-K factor RskA